jgi:hypothetical protein
LRSSPPFHSQSGQPNDAKLSFVKLYGRLLWVPIKIRESVVRHLVAHFLVPFVLLAILGPAVGCGGSSDGDKIVGEETVNLRSGSYGVVGIVTVRQYGNDDVVAVVRNTSLNSWNATVEVLISADGEDRSKSVFVEVLRDQKAEEIFLFKTQIDIRRASLLAILTNFERF